VKPLNKPSASDQALMGDRDSDAYCLRSGLGRRFNAAMTPLPVGALGFRMGGCPLPQSQRGVVSSHFT